MVFLLNALWGTTKSKTLFEELYNTYKGYMASIAFSVLHEHHIAEDAVHAAFEKVLKNIDKFKGLEPDKQKGLIAIMTRNVAIDMVRKNRAPELPLNDALYISRDIGSGDYQEVLAAIRKLKKPDSDIVMLKFVYGYDFKEIGVILSISAEAARKRWQRAKATLIDFLEAE